MEEARNKLSVEAFENLQKWLTDPELSFSKTEIQNLIKEKNWQELEDAFYDHVRIGTAGVRGKIGPGPNRINLRTIGEAAQGLAQFIQDFGPEAKAKGVVVGHEARVSSREFAVLCCQVLAANEIKTFLFEDIRSTPEVSFAIRHLKATAGVMITASHSPRTDNGFKFFWTYGGQVVPPLDQKYMDLVMNVREIKLLGFERAKREGFVKIIGKEIDEAYLSAISELFLIKNRTAKIIFSPLHSSGRTNVFPILKKEGFDVQVVEEQWEPDENFPTAFGDFINPEYKQLLDLSVAKAQKIDADLAICSDPDSCRMGVAVRKSRTDDDFVVLTGNEIGVIILYFLLRQLDNHKKLNPDLVVMKTYVTTDLISDIARDFNVKLRDDLLVGFKWIGEAVEKLENKNDFLFAFEDTLGFLRGTFIRDKDAAIGAFTIAEIVSYLKDQKKTAVDYLKEIYQRFGVYRNIITMVGMSGKSGFEDTTNIMLGWREKPPTELSGLKVLKNVDKLDLNLRKRGQYKTGVTGDQLTFILSEDEKVKMTVRPSGTEPQLKYYFQYFAKVEDNVEKTKELVDKKLEKLKAATFEYQDKIVGKIIRGDDIKSNW